MAEHVEIPPHMLPALIRVVVKKQAMHLTGALTAPLPRGFNKGERVSKIETCPNINTKERHKHIPAEKRIT
jgi:hypothetical protein